MFLSNKSSKTLSMATFFLIVATSSVYAFGDSSVVDTLKNYNLNEVVITSGVTSKYNAGRLSRSFRLQAEPLNLSQNVQNVSPSMLQDQMSLNVNENITRNVSSTFREELHNGISADIYSRGGYINPMRNGVDLRPILKGPLGDDIALIESIEFAKGPSLFMGSIGDPAGSYNIIIKKPTGLTRYDFGVTTGSFNLLRGEADLEGAIDVDKKWLYRFNLMGMYKGGFMKFDTNDRVLFAPSLKYAPSNTFSITAQYVFQRMNYKMLSEAQISPYGFGTLPTDFTITDPSNRPYRGIEHNAYITLEKSFSDNWNFTMQLADVYADSKGAIYWVYGKNEEDIDILDRYLVYDAMKYNVFSTQAFVSGRFKIGEVGSFFNAGIDFNHKMNKTADTWETASVIYPLSISNPIYSEVINNNFLPGGDFDSENAINNPINLTDSKLYYFSVYAMDEFSFFNEKLKVNAGLRYTYSKAKFLQYGEDTNATDNVLTPRVGVNYRFLPNMSLYALYDNTFMPQAGIAHDKNPLKPIRGTSYEIGLKQEWFNKALSTSISLYKIKRTNMIIKDPATNNLFQTGRNEANGVEVDVRGMLFNGFNVIVNYAYTDSKITRDEWNPEMVGMATPNRVKHIQNTWLNYNLPFKTVKGITCSLGYQFLAGRTERFSTMDPQELKNLFRLDGGVTYSISRYRFNVVVNNILNTKQYSTAWKQNDMYYWVQLPPINFRCSIHVTI